jgi:hypothetical protein
MTYTVIYEEGPTSWGPTYRTFRESSPSAIRGTNRASSS